MNNIFHQVLNVRQINIHLDSTPWRASDCVKYTWARDTMMMPLNEDLCSFLCHAVAPFISAINKTFSHMENFVEKFSD